MPATPLHPAMKQVGEERLLAEIPLPAQTQEKGLLVEMGKRLGTWIHRASARQGVRPRRARTLWLALTVLGSGGLGPLLSGG